MNRQYMEREARLQIEGGKPAKEQPASNYNIWYHKDSYLPDTYETELIRAATRCDIEQDSGRTKAKPDSYLCLHFIRGECCMGPKCRYFHHVPGAEEIKHIPITKDVFGRDRHSTDKDDMTGVGNFNKENKTIFVSRLPAKAPDIYNLLYKHFSEYGEIAEINVPPENSIAFVRYRFRHSAEIAKTAMDCQSLGFADILQVRWAHADPNPERRKVAEEAERLEAQDVLYERAAEIMSARAGPHFDAAYSAECFGVPTQPTDGDGSLYADLAAQRQSFARQTSDYYNWLSIDRVPSDDDKNNENLTENRTEKRAEKRENLAEKNEKMAEKREKMAEKSEKMANFAGKRTENGETPSHPYYAAQPAAAMARFAAQPPPGIAKTKKKAMAQKAIPFSTQQRPLPLRREYRFPDILANIEREAGGR